MSFGWDPAKSQHNERQRGLPFSIVADLDWSTAVVVPSEGRTTYAESRYVALGRIHGVVHAVVFTPRGSTLWIISVRRASRKERRAYGDANQA